MNILYLSPVHPLLAPGNPLPRWQMHASHIRALANLDHSVHVVRYTPADHVYLGWGERIAWNIRVLREIRRIRDIDVVLFSLGADVLFPQTIHYIKSRMKAPLVVLSGVSPIADGNPRERAIGKFADLVATNDASHAKEWRSLGAKRTVVLPISAIDPELHYPRRIRGARGNRGARDIDVVFAGTVTPDRAIFFQKFRKLLAPEISFVVKHHIFEEDYAQLLSRAKIALNPLRPEMAHGANLRLFEIPAFGALQLASFSNQHWLTPKREVVVYRDAPDAAKLIVYYLSHQKERETIVARARMRVCSEHTFEKRFETLVMRFVTNP